MYQKLKTIVKKSLVYIKKQVKRLPNRLRRCRISFLSPSPVRIRAFMQKSGLDAYRSYCVLREIKAANPGMRYKSILASDLYRTYKEEKTEAMLSPDQTYELPRQPLNEAAFYRRFHTRRQQKAMEEIVRTKSITYRTLGDFLEIKIPHRFLADKSDISDLIRFRKTALSSKGSILFIRRMNISPAALRRQIEQNTPVLLITKPEIKQQLGRITVPVVTSSDFDSHLLDLSGIYKSLFPMKTIAITGSVGKSTTAQMVYMVARQAFRSFKAYGNQNTELKVSSLIYRIPVETEVLVQECSGCYPSQAEQSGRVLHADIFIITNIGHSHVVNFKGDQRGILYEKLSYDRTAAPNAVGILNGDDSLLSRVQTVHPVKYISVQNPEADFYAANIREQNGVLSFDCTEKDGTVTPIEVSVCGVHNAYNALAAFAAGVLLGMERSKIAAGLKQFSTGGIRQNVERLAGRTLYLDCYNAAAESIHASLSALKNFSVPESRRKIAVIGDIAELGDKTEPIHRSVGKMITEIGSADEVFFYGDNMRLAYEVALSAGAVCRHTSSRDELEAWIREDTKPGDLILFKASHAMQLQRVLDDLFGTDYLWGDDLTANAKVVTVNGGTYRCVPGYGSALDKADKKESSVSLPDTVDEIALRALCKGAFRNDTTLTEIRMPDSVLCIAEEVFSGCSALQSVRLSSGLLCIERNAFMNCSALTGIDIPEGCMTLCRGAFRSCTALKDVSLPASLLTIDDEAFAGCPDVQFRTVPGSYAEQWVAEHFQS